MLGYTVQRLRQGVVTLFVIIVVTFGIIHLAPGGVAILAAQNASAQDLERIRVNLGLKQPIYVQFWKWSTHVVRGDFGRSFNDSTPVLTLLKQRLPNTLELMGAVLLLSSVLGVFAGIYAARHVNSWRDQVITTASFVGVAVPPFWLGIMCLMLFSVKLHWLPSGGIATPHVGGLNDRLKHLVLPALVLSVQAVPPVLRFTRSSLIGVLRQDYVRTARAKGLAAATVLRRHALRNSLIPVITVIGAGIPRLVGGAAVSETVFAWPGIGRLAVDAAFHRDYPLIMGITIMVSVVVVLSTVVVDLAYAVVNPRIRLT